MKRNLIIFVLMIMPNLLFGQNLVKDSTFSTETQIKQYEDDDVHNLKAVRLLKQMLDQNERDKATELIRYFDNKRQSGEITFSEGEHNLLSFISHDYQNILHTNLYQKDTASERHYYARPDDVRESIYNFTDRIYKTIISEIDSCILEEADREYLKLVFEQVRYSYTTVEVENKVFSLAKEYLKRFPGKHENAINQIIRVPERELDWVFGLSFGGSYLALTNDLSSYLSSSGGFNFALETGIKQSRLRIDCTWLYPKVKKGFSNAEKEWKENLPLDATEVGISAGFNLPRVQASRYMDLYIRPMITFSGLILETDNRVKDYTSEDNKMTVNMLGFTILTSILNMRHNEGGSIQLTAGMSWPLKENSQKFFGGYLIRFGFHLAMLTY